MKLATLRNAKRDGQLVVVSRDLAQAIDSYKLMHRRRFITYEELLGVIESLGYRK